MISKIVMLHGVISLGAHTAAIKAFQAHIDSVFTFLWWLKCDVLCLPHHRSTVCTHLCR